MRIISGTARGRKLCPPPLHNKSIRPTSDRAREALFSILGNRVHGARVLDLFAGTGALGLEALSRSADLVVFVDNSPQALQLVKKNIDICSTGLTEKCTIRVLRHDLTRNLPISKLLPYTLSGFDIIFVDPPYSRNISLSILDFLSESSLLARNGLLIIEERHNVDLPRNLPTLSCIDKRTYGETVFYFYQVPSTS
ncbi:MAG: 16S rRNA (guanine(966)-N(2))-methyltransferase RsmD [Desulforhopalus sp.]